MSWSTDLRRWTGLPWRDRLLLVEAAAALGMMALAVGRVPFRRISSAVGLQEGEPGPCPAGREEDALRVSEVLRVAGSRVPWECSCLVRALAGAVLLRRRGIPGVLHLGVTRDAAQGGDLSAHAWLASGDVVLSGDEGRERFQPISRFAL